MKILVLGAGSIGRRHITNLVAIGHDDLVVADPDASALEKVARLCGSAETTTGIDAAFDRGPFEAVFICSPPQHHLDQLNAAIAHGCHAFVEKPFALTAAGVENALKRADANGLRVMTAFNMRYLELIRKMRAWLDEGRIGRVLGCRINLSSYMPVWHSDEDYRQSFMAFSASGGGALFDYVHGIDLVQWLAGTIDTVACIQRTTSLEMETDDVAALSCTTDSGAVCSLYFDFVDRGPRKSLDLIGTGGTMLWEYDTEERLRLNVGGTREHTRIVTRENYARCYVDEIRDFFRCIESGEPLLSDGWNGLSTQRVLDMAVESNRSNRIVSR